MNRHTALAAVVFVLMSSLPQQVAAGGGERPLRSWCNSPTMEYCVSLLSWEYTFSAEDAYPQEGDIFIRATLRGFGSALSQGRGFELDPFGYGIESASGFIWDVVEGLQFSEPGQVVAGAEATNILTPVRELTVDDFAFIDFYETGPEWGSAGCVTSKAWSRRLNLGARPICYRVPEPSTWLMMATGLLGLGVVAWRRKEENEAA